MDENAATVQVTLIHGMHFAAHGTEGATVLMDSDDAFGGQNMGARPLQLLLIALGGCTGMDVISILRKKRQDVADYRIEVSGVQQKDYPHVYTDIAIHHMITGNVSETAMRRAVELSETKYCSVYAMLSKAASITTTIDVLPAAPSD